MNDQISLIVCPDCGLMMSEPERSTSENSGWRSLYCWRCGHAFGGFSDRGGLDLGITDPCAGCGPVCANVACPKRLQVTA